MLLLLALPLVLSLSLTAHSLIVEVESFACFENLGASIDGGERPYLRVGEMSVSELAQASIQQFSAEDLILAGLGLLPMLPFLIAWLVSRDKETGMFWPVSGFAALIIIGAGVSRHDLTAFYDCDLNGVSLGMIFAPILFTAINTVAVIILAAFRSVALDLAGRK